MGSSLSLVGLANWLPFFWRGFNTLTTKTKKKSRTILISGSFPVILTGFGQYFFNWNGPLDLFNGLIVWYQKPIEITGGLTGFSLIKIMLVVG